MDFSEIPPDTLARWYRLALLLTGRPASAEMVLLATFGELASMLDQIRSEKSQHEAFVRRLRDRCLAFQSTDLSDSEGGAPTFAQTFAALPEPARSATALFYLKLLTPAEIAALLSTTFEEVADLLASGRADLQKAAPLAEIAPPASA